MTGSVSEGAVAALIAKAAKDVKPAAWPSGRAQARLSPRPFAELF